MVSCFAGIKIFRFWPKTMDYSQALRSNFFSHPQLLAGRRYGAEICAITLLLRCPFWWYPFLPESKFSDFGRKPWTIVRRFDRNRGHCLWSFYSSLEGAMKLKLCHSAPFEMLFRMASFFAGIKISDSGRKPWTIVRRLDQISFCTHTCVYISSLEGATELKLRHYTPLEVLFPMISLLAEIEI